MRESANETATNFITNRVQNQSYLLFAQSTTTSSRTINTLQNSTSTMSNSTNLNIATNEEFVIAPIAAIIRNLGNDTNGTTYLNLMETQCHLLINLNLIRIQHHLNQTK